MSTPDTIVLIHGFWVTPRSWEHWKARYEAKGFTVHTPAYPGFEVEVEALRADPTPIADLTSRPSSSHLEAFLDTLDTDADPDGPLRRRGVHAGGDGPRLRRARGSRSTRRPTEGVRVTPWSQLHSVFPVLKNPANHHRAVGFDAEQWTYAFTNTYTDGGVARVLRALPHPRVGPGPVRLGAGQLPARSPGRLGRLQEPDRAPLLFLSGSEDHIMPPSVQASNAKHYKGEGTITEHETYEGRPHLHGRRRRLGGDRRPRPRVGARARGLGAAPSPRRVLSGVDRHLHPHRGPTDAARGGRVADPDRPDVRRPRPDLQRSAGARRRARRPVRRSRRRARADRRRPAHPRPPRRQPRRRRPRAAAGGRRRCSPPRRARVGSAAAPGVCARGQPTALERPGRPTITVTATPCRHGPPRQPADRRRRSSASRCTWEGQEHGPCGSRATPCSTTASARSRSGSTSAPRSCTSAGPVPDDRPARATR